MAVFQRFGYYYCAICNIFPIRTIHFCIDGGVLQTKIGQVQYSIELARLLWGFVTYVYIFYGVFTDTGITLPLKKRCPDKAK